MFHYFSVSLQDKLVM